MKIEYYSPSYRRAGAATIFNYMDDINFVVGKNEFEGYRKYYKNVIAIPDRVNGNIARVRNWILDNSDADIIVMIDDDVEYIQYFEDKLRYIVNAKKLKRLVMNWAEIAIDIGTVLFGVNLTNAPKHYREYAPFSFLSPVCGTFFCVVNNSIRFDERLYLNEDYDYFIQVMNECRKVLRVNKYHYQVNHLTKAGGCTLYRTMDREKEQARIMIKKWGDKIVQYKFEKTVNPLIHIPIKGI